MPENGSEAWNKKVPWWIDEAIVVVRDFIKPEFSVFEWGIGGSTIWFARQVVHVVSIENNKGWYDRVKGVLVNEGICNVDLKYLCNDEYTGAIGAYPDQSFDIVVVDGRMRVGCIKGAIQKVKVGGKLILDDSQRGIYKPGTDLLAGWPRVDISNGARSLSIFTRR